MGVEVCFRKGLRLWDLRPRPQHNKVPRIKSPPCKNAFKMPALQWEQYNPYRHLQSQNPPVLERGGYLGLANGSPLGPHGAPHGAPMGPMGPLGPKGQSPRWIRGPSGPGTREQQPLGPWAHGTTAPWALGPMGNSPLGPPLGPRTLGPLGPPLWARPFGPPLGPRPLGPLGPGPKGQQPLGPWAQGTTAPWAQALLTQEGNRGKVW